MKHPIVFIICTEQGDIESKSLLFARSLRKFGGSLRNAPIYSYAPRKGFNISYTTQKMFEEIGVRHKHIILNDRYPGYPLANKPLVAAHAEETIDSEIIVFVDSDMVVLNDPSDLFLSEDYEVAVRPEDVKGIGVSSKYDKEWEYWSDLSEALDVEQCIRVTTTVDREQILGYWNTGLVAARRQEGLFSSWADNFQTVMRSGLEPQRGIFFIEQSVFSATIQAEEANFFTLPHKYNYPIHLHERMNTDSLIRKLDDMVTVHYHNEFSYGLRDCRDGFLESISLGKKGEWLKDQVCKDYFMLSPVNKKLYKSDVSLFEQKV